MENYDRHKCAPIGDLIALVWRVVGNEFRDDRQLVFKAGESILHYCDGVEEATEAFSKILED